MHVHICGIQNLRLLYSVIIFFGIRQFDANYLSEIITVCIEQHRLQKVDKLFEKGKDKNLLLFAHTMKL